MSLSGRSDQYTLEMRMDHKQFDNGVSTTLSTLDKLKSALNMSGATKGLDDITPSAKDASNGLDSLAQAVQNVSNWFTPMGRIANQVLTNIVNDAYAAGKKIVEALTIDPIKTGYDEYELKMDSIKTILSNTNGKNSLEEIKKVLEELNHYADDTIYNFGQMTSAMGRMSAQGIDLYDAEKAIRGMSNLAAYVGASSQSYTNAMNFGLVQALAMGELRVQDWKSFENANISSKVFRDELIKTADAMGYFNKTWYSNQGQAITGYQLMEEASEHFRNTLKFGWVDNEVLLQTLAKFADTESELGAKAQAAAREVRTVTKLKDQLLESLQSGWAYTWEYIIGDIDEATEVLTHISEALSSIFDKAAEERNAAFKKWHDSPINGRETFITAFAKVWDYITKIMTVFDQVKKAVFGNDALYNFLTRITGWLDNFAYGLEWNTTLSSKLYNVFSGAMSIIDIVLNTISAGLRVIAPLLEPIGKAFGFIFDISAKVGSRISAFNRSMKANDSYYKSLQKIYDTFKRLISPITDVVSRIYKAVKAANVLQRSWEAIKKIFSNLSNAFDDVKKKIKGFYDSFKASNAFVAFSDKLEKLKNKIVNFGSKGILRLTSWLERLSNKKIKVPDFTYEGFVKALTDLKDKVSKTFETIKSTISEKIESVKQFFIGSEEGSLASRITGFFESVKGKIKEITGVEINLPFVDTIKEKIAEAKTYIEGLVEKAKTKLQELTGFEIKLPTLADLQEKLKEAKNKVIEFFDSFKLSKTDASGTIEYFSLSSDKLKIITDAFETFKTKVTEAKDKVVNFFKTLLGSETDESGTIEYFITSSDKLQIITDAFNNIKEAITGAFNTVKTKVEEFTGIEFSAPNIDSLTETITNLLGPIKSIPSKIEAIKNKIEEFTGIDFKMPSLETFKTTVTGIFDSIKSIPDDIGSIVTSIEEFLGVEFKAPNMDDINAALTSLKEALTSIPDKLIEAKNQFEEFTGIDFKIPTMEDFSTAMLKAKEALKSVPFRVKAAIEQFKDFVGIDFTIPTMEDLNNALTKAKESLKSLPTRIRASIEQFKDFIGINFTIPTMEDLSNALTKAKEALKSLPARVKAAIGQFKDFIGIDFKVPTLEDLATALAKVKESLKSLPTRIKAAIDKFEEFTGIDLRLPNIEDFKDVISKIKSIFTRLANAAKNAKNKLVDFLSLFKKTSSDDDKEELDSTAKSMENFEEKATLFQTISEKISDAVTTIKESIGTIKTLLSNGFTSVTAWLKKFFGFDDDVTLDEIITKVSFVLDLIKQFVTIKFMSSVSKFLDDISNKFLDRENLLEKIANILKTVGATALMAAAAITLLVGSLKILSSIDPLRVQSAVLNIAELMVMLVAFMAGLNFTKAPGGLSTAATILALATALGILSGAIFVLSLFSPERFEDGAWRVIAALAAIAGAAALAKTTLGVGAGGTAATILALGIALGAVTAAIFVLSSFSPDRFWEGAKRVIVALVAIAGAAVLAKTTLGVGAEGTAGVILAMSVSLVAMAFAMEKFEGIGVSTIAKGLATMVVSLVALAAVSTGLAGLAPVMIEVAVALGLFGLSLIALEKGLEAGSRILDGIGTLIGKIVNKIQDAVPVIKDAIHVAFHNISVAVSKFFLDWGDELLGGLADFVEFILTPLDFLGIGQKIGNQIRGAGTWLRENFDPGDYWELGATISDTVGQGIKDNDVIVIGAVEDLNNELPDLVLNADYTQIMNLASALDIPFSEVESKIDSEGYNAAVAWLNSLSGGMADTSGVESAATNVGNSILNGFDANSILAMFSDTGIQIPEDFSTNINSMLDEVLGSGSNIHDNLISGVDFSDLTSQFSQAGLDVPSDFNDSINSMLNEVFSSAEGMHNEVLDGFNGDVLVSDIEYFATSSADSFNNGLSSKKTDAYNAAVELANEAKAGLDTADDGADTIGHNTVQGFINGMSSLLEPVKTVATSIGNWAINALSGAVQTNSPSKLTTKIGGYFGQGFINGMKNLMGKISLTSDQMGTDAVESLTNPLRLLDRAFDTSLNTNPVITPVIDMSNVESGIGRINAMAGQTNLLFKGISADSINGVGKITMDYTSGFDDLHSDINALSKLMEDSIRESGNSMTLLRDDMNNFAANMQTSLSANGSGVSLLREDVNRFASNMQTSMAENGNSVNRLRGDISMFASNMQNAQPNTDNMALLNDIATLMNKYFPEFASRQVVLDSGAMVGEMTPKINRELRSIANRNR